MNKTQKYFIKLHPLFVAFFSVFSAVIINSCSPASPTLTNSQKEVKPVVFDHMSGIYATAFTVKLSSATPEVRIFYTTDGSDPRTSITRIQSFSVSIDKSMTVRCVAVLDDYIFSDVSECTYNLLQYSIIDSVGSFQFPRICVDLLGNSSICYIEGATYVLYCAKLINGQWIRQVVDNKQSEKYSCDIASDNLNNLHISYSTRNESEPTYLSYAENSSGAWLVSLIDGLNYGASGAAIAIDRNNNVHIAYDCQNSLHYLTNKNNDWKDTALGEYFGGNSASIALDAFDNIYICHSDYFASSTKTLWLTYCVNGLWSNVPIDSNTTGQSDWYISSGIKIDRTGAAHLLYSGNQFSSGTKYGKFVNGKVKFEWVSKSISKYSEIDIDSNNIPHVLYSDLSSGLQYVSPISAGTWTNISISKNYSLHHDLCIDNKNRFHITYYDKESSKLMYVTY